MYWAIILLSSKRKLPLTITKRIRIFSNSFDITMNETLTIIGLLILNGYFGDIDPPFR